MESTSRIYTCPSFNRNSSSDIADIADRVVQELRLENGFQNDDVFSFSDEDNPQGINNNNNNNKQEVINNMNMMPKEVQEEDEFEFPVIYGNSNSYSTPVSVSDTTYQIPVKYPVFDQSLLSETEVESSNNSRVDLNLAEPVQSTRPSLRKLLSEDRDAPSMSSFLDGAAPGTYCVWKPKENKETPRGKHKKSNSVSVNNNNISKRWKVKDLLLKRSYSDDSYSKEDKDSPVVVFLPPILPKGKPNGENTNKTEKTVKPEKNIPPYRTKIGNIRVPPYLPYRQGQVAAFSNFNGSNNMYRY